MRFVKSRFWPNADVETRLNIRPLGEARRTSTVARGAGDWAIGASRLARVHVIPFVRLIVLVVVEPRLC